MISHQVGMFTTIIYIRIYQYSLQLIFNRFHKQSPNSGKARFSAKSPEGVIETFLILFG